MSRRASPAGEQLISDVAVAWSSLQPPALLDAFRVACGCRPPIECLHMTAHQRRLVDEWVERTIARGAPHIRRLRQRGAIVTNEQGENTIVGTLRPGDDVDPEKAPLRCDWPGCEFRTPAGLRQPKSSLGQHKRAHTRGTAAALKRDKGANVTGADIGQPAGQDASGVSTELDRVSVANPATFLGALAVPEVVEDLGRLFGDDAVVQVHDGVLTVSKVA